MGRSITWAILTGEYPPDVGGVADYTRIVAEALASAGDAVRLWTPSQQASPALRSGVWVHPLPDRYSPRGLGRLQAELAALPQPYRLLLQYTPNAFGLLGTNFAFGLWLAAQRTRPWVMFHELYMPLTCAHSMKYNALAVAQRAMLALVMLATERAFVSIPSWGEQLEEYSNGQPIDWLPIFSNIGRDYDPSRRDAIRRKYQPHEAALLGHFGTFGSPIANLLAELLPPLLERDVHRRCLLIGSGSIAFAAKLAQAHPMVADRIDATGILDAPELAAHLAACDLLVQPYPDGVSTRRGSLIAGMALGVPTVSPVGVLSEPFWLEEQPIIVVRQPTTHMMLAATECALSDRSRLAQVGQKAKTFYDQHLDVKHTVAALRCE